MLKMVFPYGIIKSKSTISIHVQVCAIGIRSWYQVMQFPPYTTVLEEFRILCINNNIVQYDHRFKSDANQKATYIIVMVDQRQLLHMFFFL